MLNLLDVLFEYQTLRTAMELLDSDRAGAPGDDVEQARLLGLGRLLTKKSRSRLAHPVPAQLTVPGGFGGGEIHSISRNGVAMTTTHSLARGTRTVVRIADVEGGVEYVFPGTIASSRGRVIGVAFDGTPSKTPYLAPRHASWRRDVRFGTTAPETLVA